MVDYLESVKRALTALEAQRRHIDEDIADLRRVVDRQSGTREGSPPGGIAPSAGRGKARTEILALLADGPMSAAEIGKARGTTRNAAYAALSRMLEEADPPIIKDDGEYKLASQSDAQPSEPAATGSEDPTILDTGEEG